jgi:hypothetical protein
MHKATVVYRAWRIVAFVSCAAIALVACSATVPYRTLPEHIKRIYIPMFQNDSRLFGAQADLTLHVNDEFMLDGRLDVVQNERADVRLEGRIHRFKEWGSHLGGDEFPIVSTMEMTCVVRTWDPYDADRIAPLGQWRVEAVVQYVSDARRSISETQTEARDRLLRQMAKNIVTTVMTTPSSPLKPLQQRGVQRYQERHGKQNYEPTITEPRFPKPTPPPKNVQ